MSTVILRRLAAAIPLLLVVSLLTFMLIPLLPGDPAATILGANATHAQIASLRESMGLDQPIVARYLTWISAALRGDLGTSYFSGQPVLASILQRLPITLSITAAATVVSLIVGVSLGTLAAMRGGLLDRIARGASTFVMAVPNFWLALLLVMSYSNYHHHLAPSGYVDLTSSPTAWLSRIALPSIALAAGATAAVALQTRAALQELMHREFVRTFRALGLSQRRVVFGHLLQNAAGPIVGVVTLQFISMLGNAVVIEQVFALPGLGTLIYTSVSKLDMPLMQGVVLAMTLLVVVVNLAADLVAAWLNPRIR
jgi:peptide/nickel transport system permease protein